MSKNPFFTADDDVDDDEFLRRGRGGNPGYNQQPSGNSFGTGNGANRPADRLMQLQEQKRQIEQRTLQSTNNSLGLLYESEKVGLATAEELNRQKEQLLATESRLDEINSTLNNSERHLNGIKSVFGGIRNYLFAKKNGIASPATTTGGSASPATPAGPLAVRADPPRQAFGASGGPTSDDYHPGLRTRGLVEADSSTTSIDDILDRNLDEMSQGLSRLKVLATGLNHELDDHDEILNRLDDKTSKVDWRVKKQNQDMEKLLRK